MIIAVTLDTNVHAFLASSIVYGFSASFGKIETPTNRPILGVDLFEGLQLFGAQLLCF